MKISLQNSPTSSKLSVQEQVLFRRLIGEVETDLSPEWKSETDRRWENYQSGKTELIDGKQMEDRLKRKYGL
ncbi:MAG: addiction module protein [Bacteroidota bacterium]